MFTFWSPLYYAICLVFDIVELKEMEISNYSHSLAQKMRL